MNNGFFSVHRRIMSWYGATSSKRVHLLVFLIGLANHKEANFMFNGEKTIVKRGQLITGRKSLSTITGISESYVEKLLKEFEKQGILEQQTSNRNRLITIVKYSHYQSSDNQEDNRKTTKRTTERQQKDTNNKDNKNNKNNNKGSHSVPPLLTDVKHYIQEKKFPVDAERFVDYYATRGWILKGGVKMKDWKAAVRTWAKNSEPTQKTTLKEL